MADDIELPLGPSDEVTEVVPNTPEIPDSSEGAEALAEDTPEPVEPPPPPEEPAEVVRLRNENSELRRWATLMEAQIRQGQPATAPPQTPEFFTHMTPEQRTAWQQSVKELQPVLDYREQQLRQYVDSQVRAANQRGEIAELRAEFGDDFRQREAQLVQVREQIARQGGQYFPLADLYMHMKGQEAVQAQRTTRNATSQARRAPAARAAAPVAAKPAGVRPITGPVSADKIKAMSDDEILETVSRQTGIPIPKIPKKLSVG